MASASDQDQLPLALSRRERQQLESVLATTAAAQQLRRAEALLWLAAGESVPAIAARLRVSRQTVYNWATRFRQREGVLEERLADGARSGRPATVAGVIDPIIDVLIDQDPRAFGYADTVGEFARSLISGSALPVGGTWDQWFVVVHRNSPTVSTRRRSGPPRCCAVIWTPSTA